MLHIYETTGTAVEHLALVKGNISGPDPILVRVHAVNMLGDLLGLGVEADEQSLIAKSMRLIAEEGRGVLVLIRDRRSKAVSIEMARVKDAGLRKRDARERRNVEVGVGSQILRDLGISDMILLTNSPKSVYVGIDGYGLRITGQRPIE